MLRHLAVCGFVCLATGTSTTPAEAAWVPNGVQVSAAPVTQAPALLPDGTGGVYIAWDGNGVRVQRLTSTGDIAFGWPADGVVVGSASADFQRVRLEADGAGGAWVAWDRIDFISLFHVEKSIHLKRINSSGTTPGFPIDGVVVSGERGVNNLRGLAADGAGGVVLLANSSNYSCSEGFCSPPNPRTWAARLLPGGSMAVGWPVDLDPGRGGHYVVKDPFTPTILVGLSGTTVHTVTRLTLDGAFPPGWTWSGVPVVVQTEGPDNFSWSRDHQGGVFLGWRDYRNGAAGFSFDVFTQHILASGELAPEWPLSGVAVAANVINEQQHALTAADDTGGEYVAWQDLRSGVWKLYALRLTASGSTAPGWSPNGAPVGVAPGFEDGHAIAPDGLGQAIVAWIDRRETVPQVFAQLLTPAGMPAPSWPHGGAAITAVEGAKHNVGLVSLAPGVTVVVWPDERAGAPRLFAQQVLSDVVTSALISVAHARAMERDVDLRWYAPQLAGERVLIERTSSGSAWSVRGETLVDADGHASFLDRGLLPGRYGYRAVVRDGDRGVISSESWVEIAPLVLQGILEVRPNPTRGAFEVLLSVETGPARLEIVDVTGRIVHTRELQRTGTSVVERVSTGRLPSGIYTIRLIGDHGSDTRRIVVVP